MLKKILVLLLTILVLCFANGAEARARHHHHFRHHARHVRHHHHFGHYRHRHWRHFRAHPARTSDIPMPPRRSLDLVTVPTAMGVPVTIARNFAAKILPFIHALKKRGIHIRRIGCYATSGHVRHSLHYLGEACDFDQRGYGLTVAAMYRLGDLAQKYGLRNGCSFGDCGHIDSGRGRLARNPFYPRGWFARYRATHDLSAAHSSPFNKGIYIRA